MHGTAAGTENADAQKKPLPSQRRTPPSLPDASAPPAVPPPLTCAVPPPPACPAAAAALAAAPAAAPAAPGLRLLPRPEQLWQAPARAPWSGPPPGSSAAASASCVGWRALHGCTHAVCAPAHGRPPQTSCRTASVLTPGPLSGDDVAGPPAPPARQSPRHCSGPGVWQCSMKAGAGGGNTALGENIQPSSPLPPGGRMLRRAPHLSRCPASAACKACLAASCTGGLSQACGGGAAVWLPGSAAGNAAAALSGGARSAGAGPATEGCRGPAGVLLPALWASGCVAVARSALRLCNLLAAFARESSGE